MHTAEQKILVTGATGFTGGALARELLRQGCRVRLFIREAGRFPDDLKLNAEIVMGDLRDVAACKRAVAGVDVVYHIAAVFRDAKATQQELFAVNMDGTGNMLAAAENAGVGRFIHCSTGGVHGHIKNPPADENAPFKPGDAYQESKLAGENLARQAMESGRLPLVIVRPAGIYGPGDTRFLKLFRGIQRRQFVMVGSGQVRFHLVYIDDLVEGFLRCGTMPDAIGGTYLLAGAQDVTLNALVAQIAAALEVPPPRLKVPFTPVYAAGFLTEMLCKPLGIAPPLYRRRVDFFRKQRSFDIRKAQNELNYAPQVDLAEGIRRTAAWYRQQGML